jgi:uncharacterized protein YbaR (Trm112 family)
MQRDLLTVYVCPLDHSRLRSSSQGTHIINDEIVSEAGACYQVRDGVPLLFPGNLLTGEERATQAEYDAAAEEKYDAAVDWLFQSFYENEDKVREGMNRSRHWSRLFSNRATVRAQRRILRSGSF